MIFRLSEFAEQDLYLIWLFGREKFGEAQADQFVLALYEQFEQLARSPMMYPEVVEVKPGYRKCVFQSVSIYYRINNEQLEVMAIIGSQNARVWVV